MNFRIFDKQPILAAFSTIQDGSCRLSTSYSPEANATTERNRSKFLEKIGVDQKRVVSADLIRGANVRVVGSEDGGKIIPKTDALITNDKNIFLSIGVADCLPIFIYDSKKKAIALIHAGWQGLSGGIIKRTVDEMMHVFKSNPRSFLVGIGPGIGPCHYNIKEDRAKLFKEFPGVLSEREGKIFLDLKKTAAIQLQEQGVPENQIEVSEECTYCLPEKYFSYRRDKPKIIEVMRAVFGML